MAKKGGNPAAKTATVAEPAKKRRLSQPTKLCLLLMAIACMVYGNTLKNGFAVDDSLLVINNKYVAMGAEAMPRLLVTPHQQGYWHNANDEYRPLSLVFFAAIHQVWQYDPAPYHAFNILLFAGCVGLLFLFLYDLFGRQRLFLAFIAALLFALHPIHTEVVANVKSADELLCFLLVLAGLNVAVRYTRTGSAVQLLAAFLCFFAAMLAKETAFTFILLVPVIFFFFINEHKRRSLYISICFGAATVAFLAVRYAVLSYWQVNSVPEVHVVENALQLHGLPAASRLATAILMLGTYIKLLLVPYPLICDYSLSTIPYSTFADPLVLLSLAVYLGLIIFAVWRFMKDRRDPVAFAILFFMVTIALFSNIVIVIKATMAERFLFFPSVGFCIVTAFLLEYLAGSRDIAAIKKPLVLGILLPVCLLYAAVTTGRNTDWVNNYTLYSTDIVKAPDNTRLNYFLGSEQFAMYKSEPNPVAKQQLLTGAIASFSKALAVYPDYEYAIADIAAAYFCNGQMDSALRYDLDMVRRDPKYALARNNLSGVYLQLKRYNEEIAFCKESILLTPDNNSAYADIGLAFQATGLYDSVIRYMDMGIVRIPEFYGFYDIKSRAYGALGKQDSVARYQAIAQSLFNQQKQ